MRAERTIAIVRDTLFLAMGLGGIAYQQVTGRVSEALLLVYTALLGIPAGIGLLSQQRNGGTATTGSSSPSPGPPSSPVSPTPSPSASGGEG